MLFRGLEYDVALIKGLVMHDNKSPITTIKLHYLFTLKLHIIYFPHNLT